ncbi:Long chain fatty alcohol oxidase-like protein [Venustampulla echinocandica]|uniref:Long-chain-alcohol oxidase n=1 Tax=Venustampulla echinocandica TaxID=2656787 RepID=A0A370TYI7_9HELO|nr:Long chain fatty alcohol oxidase-like protein [Venustampulla echinocandica]RDL40582.1 Long chain fatty alcohol oxidase-like protein [Venustampulla echinocandica]
MALSQLAPLPTILPDGPSEEPFTPVQWNTLMALMDAVIPSIQRGSAGEQKGAHLALVDAEYNNSVRALQKSIKDAPDAESFDKYLNEKASDCPQFQDLLKRALGQDAPEQSRKGLAFILSTLNTRVGSLMLTGYSTPIHEQPIRIREAILDSWRLSYMPFLNVIYKSMTSIGKSLWLRTSPTYRQLCGIPRAPDQYKPGPSFEFDFLQFGPGSEPEVIETDVVIVGSGCGGAVCAKNLAEAGNRVLVVDKSHHFGPEQFPLSEKVALNHVIEAGGVLVSDDGSVSVAAGSVWGGGGTINWSASLQTQNFVRKEWAQDKGLKFFETAEYQSCLDRVCHRMGVSADHIRHNHGNQVLLEGARKLGYHAKAVPQNTGGNEHYCGHCCLGCGSNEKQGPVVSWLPDAAKAGAKFVEGFRVDRVLFDKSNSTKAIGVEGVWTSRNSNGGVDGPISERTVRKVIVKAKKVIISSGTLWSPIILMNSGLKNWHIGRNLYLHPVNFVAAVFKEEVKPWEGGILTTVCTSFENLDGRGHGAKIEATAMLPSMFLVYMNWVNGLTWKTNALKIRNMNGYISIARDRDTGRIYPDPNSGTPRIQYSPSAFDRASCMEGLVALAKMTYVSGATEIHPFIQGLQPFLRDVGDSSLETPAADEPDPGVTDPRFGAWLAELQRIGNKPPTAAYSSAHQMGTNRMSAREKDGVVDPKGKVWGTEGLYVSDASVFPSASGVNPMITNMAISDWISRNIAKELRGGGSAMESRL